MPNKSPKKGVYIYISIDFSKSNRHNATNEYPIPWLLNKLNKSIDIKKQLK